MNKLFTFLRNQNPWTFLLPVATSIAVAAHLRHRAEFEDDRKGIWEGRFRHTPSGDVQFKYAFDIAHHEMGWAYNAIKRGGTPEESRLTRFYHQAFCPNASWRVLAKENEKYMAGLAEIQLVIAGYMERNNISRDPPDGGCWACPTADAQPGKMTDTSPAG